jgi:hypothetical protein
MARAIPAQADTPALTLALRLVEDALAELIAQARQGVLGDWEVAVVGGSGGLRSLLPGTRIEQPFVPLAGLPDDPLLPTPTAEGEPDQAVLSEAGKHLQGWLARHERALRPLVVSCLDEDGIGPVFNRLARSLRSCCTPAGSTLLLGCGFSTEVPEVLAFPIAEQKSLPPCWRSAGADLSWGRVTGGVEAQALALNDPSPDWIVRMALLLAQARLSGETVRRLGGNDPVACEVQTRLWAPKDGNSDDEWEDALAVAGEQGLAVVADGAGQGIFSRLWADLLTRRFLDTRPDVTDSAALNAWLTGCRRAWREGIHYSDLHGLAQAKVDETGAAATLLALGLEQEQGRHRWRAAAVGDSCLFCVRDGELLVSFPVTHSRDFGCTPNLVQTLRGSSGVRVVTAEGKGKVGDLYGLATDAVAQFVLRCYENGTPPDWERWWNMDGQEWRQLVQEWRDGRRMVNDDATLVLLRVTG